MAQTSQQYYQRQQQQYYSPPQLCALPECQRPCFESDGIVHSYCGRTHAEEALNRGMLQSLQKPHGSCQTCALNGCSATVYFEADIGRVHDFCSKKHAQLAIDRGEWSKGGGGSKACALPECNQRVYRDPATGREYDYCGRTHARQALAVRHTIRKCSTPHCNNDAWIDAQTGRSLLHCSSQHAGWAGLPVGASRCSLPGCTLPQFCHPDTREELSFCGEKHRLLAVARNLAAVTEQGVERVFRGGRTAASEFKLSLLMKTHQQFASVKGQFLDKWLKHNDPANNSPRVERIFEIKVPDPIYAAYQGYKTTKHADSVKRRFHGTSCSAACDFFVNLKGGPCSDDTCNVCSICTHGFDMKHNNADGRAASGFNLRYGVGLYFSSVSGKANDYAHGSERRFNARAYRVMFLANIVVGRAYKTEEGFIHTPCPPTGYDSVMGEVGQALNYDEVVVYNNEAAMPAYMIVYSLPG